MVLRAFHRQLIQSTSIVLCTIIGVQLAVADDFIINAPTVIANGGNTLNGNDSLTITRSGSISTTGVGTDAVIATGNNNNISVSGAITTTGNSANGIEADDQSTITNLGNIITFGNNASHGIKFDNNGSVTNSGSITTNGNDSYGIYFRDNGSAINSGSITTNDDYGIGIYVHYDSTVTNSGSIRTKGVDSFGIYAVNNNTLTNSGSIFTAGDDAEGIQAYDNNVISNTGTITTSGYDADGIDAGSNNTITNSGSISTTGDITTGIEVGSNNNILNTGLISTTGYYGRGFDGYSGNSITNSGSVTTTGDKSYGMWFFDTNTVINSGSITTAGVDAHAFNFRDNNTITNSGKAVSAQAKSFILGNNNTLNLMAPSFLGGVIDLGTNTTLNITSGLSHSILWDLSTGTIVGGAPTLGGTVPVFYNATTQKVATLDPTSLAASTDNLSDMSGNISNIIGQRLRGAFLESSSLTNHTTANPNSYFDTSEADASKHKRFLAYEDVGSREFLLSGKSWVTVMGAQTNYDGNNATNERTQTQWAMAAGYDWSPSADMRLGVMGGYTSSNLDANSRIANAFHNDSSGFFAGIYGRKALETVFVDFALTAGVTDNSSQRFVNDNLAPLGVSYAESRYRGVWISPEIAVGKHFDMGSWTATPKARLRFASQWLEGYSETGSNANATINARQVTIGEGSLELAATKNTEKGSATLRIGYLYRTSFGNSTTNVTMIGQTLSVPTFDEDRHAGYFGTNFNIHMTKTVNLELGAQLVASQSFTGIGGNIKLVAKF